MSNNNAPSTTSESSSSGQGAAVTMASATAAAAAAAAEVGHHHEDRLQRNWRMMCSSIVNAIQKADKAAENLNNQSMAKELDDAVVHFLRTRADWGRLISYLEAKLEGTAEEMDTLQQYCQTQPRLCSSESRKRKRETTEKANIVATATEAEFVENTENR